LISCSLRIRESATSRTLTGRKIAIVVLAGTTKWSRVRLHLERIAALVNAATPGSYTEVDIPLGWRRRESQKGQLAHHGLFTGCKQSAGVSNRRGRMPCRMQFIAFSPVFISDL
jgi:hypothetical protein